MSHGYISQVNEIRNKLSHSADFKLSDVELEEYIKHMTTLLQDPKQLKTDLKAMWAVVQLNQVIPSNCKSHTYFVFVTNFCY